MELELNTCTAFKTFEGMIKCPASFIICHRESGWYKFTAGGQRSFTGSCGSDRRRDVPKVTEEVAMMTVNLAQV